MRTRCLSIFMLMSHFAIAQHFAAEKKEIQCVVSQFKESIIKKDSATFNGLFHENPVVWIGVVKNRSQQKRLEGNSANRKNYFKDTYQNFFHYIMEKGGKEEKFEKIRIINDDVIASVSFNYSFREENTITNWGSEYWHLIKAEGKWKIVSIVYSYESAKFFSINSR
ncbi:Putative lumazine-binding [Pedobacter terrae]|uniref:Putative lumazine-binding n=1 Tax=Pedobacter terrae TaxID=405671 RepID=A0A1G7Q0K3_9SPHI|nr:nuclear transport factor 2 family protein [Pedobacter terrae]SDF91459.1 Putative lumazine-binding [Pedobacter terrae]